MAEDEREEMLLSNQQVIKALIVRNAKQATVEYVLEVRKGGTKDKKQEFQ